MAKTKTPTPLEVARIEKNEMGSTTTTDYERVTTSGQMVLHNFEAILGYETASLKKVKHELFCVEYTLNGGDRIAAYKKHINPECSNDNASKHASRLFKNDEIRRRINELVTVNVNKVNNTVMNYRLKVLTYDRRRLLDEEGRRIPIHLLPDDLADMVDIETAYSKEAGVVMLPKYAQRKDGADALQKILGMEKAKMELTGADGGPIDVKGIHVSFVAPEE